MDVLTEPAAASALPAPHESSTAPRGRRAATALVEGLQEQGVPFVFGIPGAKIDAVFDALSDHGPRTIVCRHEQNAAFMAAAVGRLTGRPGVCIATSGPGASNLVTGLATATTEGDPVVAIVGGVPRAERRKRTHQSMDTQSLFAAVTKASLEVDDPDDVPEALANAFRMACDGRPGAVVLTLPQDVQLATTQVRTLPAQLPGRAGPAPAEAVRAAARLLEGARLPALLIGAGAADSGSVRALHALLAAFPLPVAETFQAAGALSGGPEELFVGRVGLFRNQPGDRVLAAADVVLAVGYDPVEYGPELWNHGSGKQIVHLDLLAADLDAAYVPALELRGDVAATVAALAEVIAPRDLPESVRAVLAQNRPVLGAALDVPLTDASPCHPLALISELRKAVPDDAVVACDIGSNYIWMARHFRASGPRQLLFSDGQQTLGVAMPWAMAANLLGHRAVSVSGDGGFLFSGVELETAVREGLSFVHILMRDDTYNMVAFQEELKYGRTSGVQLGPYDLVRFAEAFGATGLRVDNERDLPAVLAAAFATPGPVLVDVPVDYRHNADFGKDLLPDDFH